MAGKEGKKKISENEREKGDRKLSSPFSISISLLLSLVPIFHSPQRIFHPPDHKEGRKEKTK